MTEERAMTPSKPSSSKQSSSKPSSMLPRDALAAALADDMAWSSGYAAGRAAAMRKAAQPAPDALEEAQAEAREEGFNAGRLSMWQDGTMDVHAAEAVAAERERIEREVERLAKAIVKPHPDLMGEVWVNRAAALRIIRGQTDDHR